MCFVRRSTGRTPCRPFRTRESGQGKYPARTYAGRHLQPRSPAPHALRYLRLTSVSSFHTFLRDVERRIYGTERNLAVLFGLKALNYAGGKIIGIPFAGYGDTDLVQAGMTLAQKCPQLQTLVLDTDSSLGLKRGTSGCFLRASLMPLTPLDDHFFLDNPPSSILPLKSFAKLREVRFDVQKPRRGRIGRHSLEMWALSFINWTKTAVEVLRTLGAGQQINQITIFWYDCEVGSKRKLWSCTSFWRTGGGCRM